MEGRREKHVPFASLLFDCLSAISNVLDNELNFFVNNFDFVAVVVVATVVVVYCLSLEQP